MKIYEHNSVRPLLKLSSTVLHGTTEFNDSYCSMNYGLSNRKNNFISSKSLFRCILFFATFLFLTCGVCVAEDGKAASSNKDQIAPAPTKKQGQMKSAAMPPPVVEAEMVHFWDSRDSITANGTFVANPGVVVKSEMAGRVVNVFFKSGEKVAAGTKLIELYPDIIRAQADQSKNEMQLAELNFNRYAKLYEQRTVSKAEYDNSNAALKSAQAKFNQYKALLSQTVVAAPFSGKVGINLVNLGQYIPVGQDIVSLQCLDPIYIDFTIPEVYASKIVVGQEVTVQSNMYSLETFHGKVFAIDSLINKNNRSLTVRAIVDNKDEKILPGSYGSVTTYTGVKKQIFKIPQTAIIRNLNETYVYRIVDGLAIKTLITTGERDAEDIGVTSGIKYGDVVVTAGQMKIMKDKDAVIVSKTSKLK